MIFVPEWLDGAGHKSRYSKQVSIPAQPTFKPISEYVANVETQHATNDAKQLVKSDQPLIHAWALQLGSFSNEANAEVMRDSLRAKGYASYVDVLKQANKITYRVRIGPELDKQQLELTKAELISKEKMETMLVKHP